MERAPERIREAASISVVFVEHRGGRWRIARCEFRREGRERDSVERIARDYPEDPGRYAAQIGRRRTGCDGGELSIVNAGGGQHSRRVHVSDYRGHLAVLDEFGGDFGSDRSVAFVIAADNLEWMAIDPAGLVDLFSGELHAL